MKSYRFPTDATTINARSFTIDVSSRVKDQTPAYASLAAQYGLQDMQITDSSSVMDQTVEQEYQSYATAPISSPGTNILKYWEVNHFVTLQQIVY